MNRLANETSPYLLQHAEAPLAAPTSKPVPAPPARAPEARCS